MLCSGAKIVHLLVRKGSTDTPLKALKHPQATHPPLLPSSLSMADQVDLCRLKVCLSLPAGPDLLPCPSSHLVFTRKTSARRIRSEVCQANDSCVTQQDTDNLPHSTTVSAHLPATKACLAAQECPEAPACHPAAQAVSDAVIPSLLAVPDRTVQDRLVAMGSMVATTDRLSCMMWL